MDALHWSWTAALGAVLADWLVIAALLWLAARRIPTLAAAPPPAGGETWPTLTAIVPARDEAAHVEAALRSLLAQDYPALDVIAVDDRSRDATGAILERLAAEAPSLTALHVERLPPGWLGKNHATQLAAAQAQGEWLLFTDADVVFAPGALRAALAFARRYGLGHLVAAPRLVAPGYWERAFQATFALLFVLQAQPWALRRPGSRAHVGVGAFNLVRAAAYRRMGGHAPLALEVVDDVKLGLLLRRQGVPQALVAAGDWLSVRWQAGFRGALRGLLKNAFAATEYRWSVTLGIAGWVAALGALPWAGLLWAPGAPLRALALAAAVLPALLVGASARRSLAGNGAEGLAAPVTLLALAAVIVASAGLATLRRGIVWRDTFYPLADLRRGAVRARDHSPRNSVGW
jgi:glycosyltransferase involved in cell wall biosynthesis